MPSASSPQPGEDQQPLQQANEKEAKAVFLPEERTPRLTWQEKIGHRLQIHNEYVRCMLAEFLGTFVLCSLGIASVAQAVTTKEKSGNIVTVVFGWGLGVAMGVYACGNASGGHINPAVTTAMTLLGRLPIKKMPFYFIGQYFGAWFASFWVFIVYIDRLNIYDKGIRLTENYENRTYSAGIWSTFPSDYKIGLGECFADQLFSTGLLVLLIMAITDERNMAVPKGIIPLVIGLGVTAILMGYASNCGGALNPARDFGPRLFTMMAGWGGDPITHRNGAWFIIPIIGPHVGGILGALFYNICVGLHWPDHHEGSSKKYEE